MSWVKDKHKRYQIALGDDDLIATSQTASTSYTLTAASVALDEPRHVLITASASAAVGLTFTVSGTDRNDQVMTETVTGMATTGGTTISTKNFKTVTAVTQSATNNTGSIWIGTDGTLEGAWIPLNHRYSHSNRAVAVDVTATGTIGFRVDKTWHEVAAITPNNENTIYATVLMASGAVDLATSIVDEAPTAVRLNVLALSGTAGDLLFHIIQS